MKILIIALLILVTVSCSAPTEPTIDTDIDIDSLLGVIDALKIQAGHRSGLINCFRATLDTLNITPDCKLGY